jgi:hypothetical protein
MNPATKVVNPSGRITRVITTTKRIISTENFQEYHPPERCESKPGNAKASGRLAEDAIIVMDLLRGESMRKINETNTWETPSETSKIGGTTNRDRNREDLVGGTWKKMSVQQISHSHRGS